MCTGRSVRVLLGLLVTGGLMAALAPAIAQEESRIDITIENSVFVIERPVVSHPGIPTIIILRNHDIVRHGFTSSIFQGVRLQAEGEGIAVYGRHLEGVYVDPGKTLILRLVIEQAGQHTFRCDLHPSMKGEVLVIDMTTA